MSNFINENVICNTFNKINRYGMNKSDRNNILTLIRYTDPKDKHLTNLLFIKLCMHNDFFEDKETMKNVQISFLKRILFTQNIDKIIDFNFCNYILDYQRSYLIEACIIKYYNTKKNVRYKRLLLYLMKDFNSIDYNIFIKNIDQKTFENLIKFTRDEFNIKDYNIFIKNLHDNIKNNNYIRQTVFMNNIRIRDRFKVLFGLI